MYHGHYFITLEITVRRTGGLSPRITNLLKIGLKEK